MAAVFEPLTKTLASAGSSTTSIAASAGIAIVESVAAGCGVAMTSPPLTPLADGAASITRYDSTGMLLDMPEIDE